MSENKTQRVNNTQRVHGNTQRVTNHKTAEVKHDTKRVRQQSFMKRVNERFSFAVPNKKESIPNFLTLLRIPLAILITCFLIFPNHQDNSLKTNYLSDLGFMWNWWFVSAAVLFFIGCLTDFLDGYLARKMKVVSNFGKLWDPITDKILINSTLISLAYINSVFAWVAVLMVVRDIVVDGVRSWKAVHGIIIPANIFGKLKTVLQMLGILYILAVFPYVDHTLYYSNYRNWLDAQWTQNAVMLFALAMSLLSGSIYTIKLLKIKRRPSVN